MVFLALVATSAAAPRQKPLELNQDDVVVFVGGTDMVQPSGPE